MELNDTYTPPGWRRGLAFLLLLAFAVLILAVAATVPFFLQGHEIPDHAPYYYPIVGDPTKDLASLRTAVWFGAIVSAVTPVLLLVPFFLLHRWLIRQPIRALNGSWYGFWPSFKMSALCVGGLWAIYLAYLYTTTAIDPRTWMTAAPVAALLLIGLLPFQVYAEELIFRGFLQRWLQERLRNYGLAMLVQSTLFAMLHPESFLIIFVLAVLATEATRVTGNLGAATGIHLAHNLGIYFKSFVPIENGTIVPGYAEQNAVAVSLIILLLAQMFLLRPLYRQATRVPVRDDTFSGLDDPARTS